MFSRTVYRIYFLILTTIFLVIFLTACSTLAVKPENIAGYNNGIAVIQDKKQGSKIQLEIAQNSLSAANSTPLLIYIIVENLSEKNITFDIDNVSASFAVFSKEGNKEDNNIKPLTFEQIKSRYINFSTPLSDYGIEIEGKNARIENTFFSSTAYYPYYYPIYFGSPFFFRYGFYDYTFSRMNMARASMMRQESQARKILISHYLRKNTLKKNDVKSGFLAFSYSSLKEGGTLVLNIKVGDDSYKFNIKLEDKSG